MAQDALRGREIFIEFYRIGTVVKVTAVDTLTMTEVIIQGPPGAGETALKDAAVRRLEYVLRKKGILG